MTFQYIRMSNDSAAIYDDNDHSRRLTKCDIHLDTEHAADLDDYVKRFGLQTATVDWVLSLIFEMGLREMKSQTDLDRYLDDQDKVPQ